MDFITHFTDTNKYIKKNEAVDLTILASILDTQVPHTKKESFHEYLRSARNITKNVYSDADNTYYSLSILRNNRNLVLLSIDISNT